MNFENVKKKTKRVDSSEKDEIAIGSEAGSTAQQELAGFLLSEMMPYLSNLVQEEVKNVFENHLLPLLESLSEKKEKEEVIIEEKLKLIFCNEIKSLFFTNSEIIGENGEALQVAICDSNTNTIISTGLLSTAQIELFVLNGEYGSSSNITMSDFNTSCILTPRYGRKPLLVGNDKLIMKNGVGLVELLRITDNSSWMKSKMFRMGARVIDFKILSMFPNIGVAVSHPFRVLDGRAEVNQKHHPPSEEDEVWRLEGIRKDGTYHKNLSLHGITNVGDFLKAYHEMGSTHLRKLLGIKVPKNIWKTMTQHAMECVSLPNYQQNSMDNYLGKEAMGAHEEAFVKSPQAFVENNLGFDFQEEVLRPRFYFEGSIPSFGETSTSYEAPTSNTNMDSGSK